MMNTVLDTRWGHINLNARINLINMSEWENCQSPVMSICF